MTRPSLCQRALRVLFLAPLALAACRQDEAPSEEALAGAKKREPARVVVEPLAQREMVRKLETSTRIESESQVQVYPRAGGVVIEILVEEGAVVEPGQLLARLDDREARLRLEDARAQLVDAEAKRPQLALAVREAQAKLDTSRRNAEQAQRDHARNLALSEGGGDRPALISSKDLEASLLARDKANDEVAQNELGLERAKVEERNGLTALARSQVAVERAELELTYTAVSAHIGGVVAERSIKVGDTVTQVTLAFTLTDLARLRAVFHRPQREFGMFLSALRGGTGPDGQVAELTLQATAEAMPGLVFVGEIERIAPTIDAASGNFRVTARMEPAAVGAPQSRLLPGMLVRLEIVTERHPHALVVPKRAVRREGDRSTIFVVEDGRARAIEVLEGFTDDASVEVSASGGAALSAGLRVVVVGNRDLEDGAEVSIALEGEPQTAAR